MATWRRRNCSRKGVKERRERYYERKLYSFLNFAENWTYY
jgi:hypothetical protein